MEGNYHQKMFAFIHNPVCEHETQMQPFSARNREANAVKAGPPTG
jgi:hypothetical protein